jgi:hypothetical protein
MNAKPLCTENEILKEAEIVDEITLDNGDLSINLTEAELEKFVPQIKEIILEIRYRKYWYSNQRAVY